MLWATGWTVYKTTNNFVYFNDPVWLSVSSGAVRADLPNAAFAASSILYDGWWGVMLFQAHF